MVREFWKSSLFKLLTVYDTIDITELIVDLIHMKKIGEKESNFIGEQLK